MGASVEDSDRDTRKQMNERRKSESVFLTFIVYSVAGANYSVTCPTGRSLYERGVCNRDSNDMSDEYG